MLERLRAHEAGSGHDFLEMGPGNGPWTTEESEEKITPNRLCG